MSTSPINEELKGRPVLTFASQSDFEDWLTQNVELVSGIWLKHAKKASGIASVTYNEAVESALCFGWIDGQKLSYDDKYFLQGYTPRRPRSIWSKVNTGRVERLISEGRLRPAGMKEVAAAKADGRWAAAYHSQRTAEVPADLQAALEANPAAKSFFATISSANRYAILFRVTEAKRPETRQRRIEQFVQMLAEHRTLH
jgi:uncharacterized protein YdeI (YjbR/CyaY-like superfamily)